QPGRSPGTVWFVSMTHGSLPAGAAQSWLRSGHCAQAPVTPRARQTMTAPPMAARCRASIIPATQQRACRECVQGSGVGVGFPSRECRDRARLHPAPDVGAWLPRPSGSSRSTRGSLNRGRDVALRCSAGYDAENQLADLRIERTPLALQRLLHDVLEGTELAARGPELGCHALPAPGRLQGTIRALEQRVQPALGARAAELRVRARRERRAQHLHQARRSVEAARL